MKPDPNKSEEGLDAGSDRDITAEIDEAEWEGIGHSGAQNEGSDSNDDDGDDGGGGGDE
jgi:hypothetical protein